MSQEVRELLRTAQKLETDASVGGLRHRLRCASEIEWDHFNQFELIGRQE